MMLSYIENSYIKKVEKLSLYHLVGKKKPLAKNRQIVAILQEIKQNSFPSLLAVDAFSITKAENAINERALNVRKAVIFRQF